MAKDGKLALKKTMENVFWIRVLKSIIGVRIKDGSILVDFDDKTRKLRYKRKKIGLKVIAESLHLSILDKDGKTLHDFNFISAMKACDESQIVLDLPGPIEQKFMAAFATVKIYRIGGAVISRVISKNK